MKAIQVDGVLTLAPHFYTWCPGDSGFIPAGDGLTGDDGQILGICPWQDVHPANWSDFLNECTVQTAPSARLTGQGSAAHAAWWQNSEVA